jgi:hypothetical protein
MHEPRTLVQSGNGHGICGHISINVCIPELCTSWHKRGHSASVWQSRVWLDLHGSRAEGENRGLLSRDRFASVFAVEASLGKARRLQAQAEQALIGVVHGKSIGFRTA